jgi:hypothetical protein
MSNSLRGKLAVDFGGQEKTIRFPNSVMRVLQERFEVKTPLEVWQSIPQWSADDWCEVFYHGLRKGSDPDITKEQVDDLIEGTDIPYYQALLFGTVNAALDGRTVPERMSKVYDRAMDKAMDEVGKETVEPEDPTNGTGKST